MAEMKTSKQTKTDNRDWAETARTLAEALPYLQQYDGKIVVIKFGGHAMSNDELMQQFARDIVLMKQCGVHPVIVHGGGPQIGAALKAQGVVSEFINGLRVTDAETMKVVEMVLAGTINKEVATAINMQGGKAVGLCGKDAMLIVAEKAMSTITDPDTGKSTEIDLGFVGNPIEVNPSVLNTFIESDLIPVIAPIGVGRDGQTYNINGDTAAGVIAGALNASRLMLLTDVSGVKDETGTVMTRLNPEKIDELRKSGVIAGGMIPKTETALDAVKSGVDAAVILDGRKANAVLLELFTPLGAGTLIHN